MKENLSSYYIFYMVGKTGNISKAARELYISQPAISRAIQKLEENLDTVLFKRTSRGVTLTPEGQLLFQKTCDAFSILSEGENAILHNNTRSFPKIRLGASSTLIKYALLPHLKLYISSHPHVRVYLSCQSTYQTLHLLEEEKIDIGLIGKPSGISHFSFYPLLQIHDIFVSTPQYLENLKTLHPKEPLADAATFMLLDEGNITRQYVDAQLKKSDFEFNHILEVNTMDLLIQFAQTGLGIACVIKEFVQEELNNGQLVEVPLNLLLSPREIGFACKKKGEDNPLLKPFLQNNILHFQNP